MHRKASSYQDIVGIAGVMERVYNESPELWPHGLSTAHYDRGDLYVIEKEASVVGFTGWQTKNEGGKLVGYYSVGVLPDYRRGGLAKEAVSRLLRERSGEVDQVKALIKAANIPSRALASSLGVHVKLAGAKLDLLKTFAKNLGIGAGGASVVDLAVNKNKGALGAMAGVEGADPWSGADFALNTSAFPAAMALKNPALRVLIPSLAASKTIATPAVRHMGKANEIAAEHVEALNNQASALRESGGGIGDSLSKALSGLAPNDAPADAGLPAPAAAPAADGKPSLGMIAAMAALGIGGGMLLGRGGKQAPAQAPGGRIKVTLPTKSPGDAETSVDLPFDQIEHLTPALRQRLERDIRRRLYAETNARTYRRAGGKSGRIQTVDPLGAQA